MICKTDFLCFLRSESNEIFEQDFRHIDYFKTQNQETKLISYFRNVFDQEIAPIQSEEYTIGN